MSASVDERAVYERAAVQQVLGDTLRPGGLGLTKRALEICGLPQGARLLDAGCGTGATVHYLRERGFAACGVDISAALLRAGRRPGCAGGFLVQADAAHLPLAAGRLAAVLAECSLSVFADADLALAEFHRLLARGGHLILSDVYLRDPDGLQALQALPQACCLQGALGQTELIARLARSGFELATWEDHSEVVRHLAGPWLAATGALAQAESGMDALDLGLAIARAKPGYYLLVARKA